jgi:antitoxin YefM
MEAMTYKAAFSNLSAAMDKVCDDHVPVIITREDHPPVVLMSLDDYNSLEETAYLMRSPDNARRLLEAIGDIERGNIIRPQLDLDE